MRKLSVVLVPLLALALILGVTACCKTVYVTPTPTLTPTISPTPTLTPSPTPTPTPTPTLTPTPTPTVILPPPTPDNVSGPPCRFHGSVTLNGANVPVGTVVTAIILQYGYTTTTTTTSTYTITIPKGLNLIYSGQTVTFKIGNNTAMQTSTWTTGGNNLVNLTANTT